MGGTRVNEENSHVPNFHLQIAAASLQKRSIFEADGGWWWQVDYLQQRQLKTGGVEVLWAGTYGLQDEAGLLSKKVFCVFGGTILLYAQALYTELYSQQIGP